MNRPAKRALVALAGLAVLAILWFQFIAVYVDCLWFGEVGFRAVFTTRVRSCIVLFVAGGLGAGGIVFGSLYLAYRFWPVFLPTTDVHRLVLY